MSSAFLFLLFFFFFYLALLNSGGSFCYSVEWELSSFIGLDMTFPFIFDFVSCVFVSVVFYISACICVYSAFYMDGETFTRRFYGLVLSFVFSMAVFIMVPSFLGIMVGWDGLGVTSFLLVVYYMDWSCLSSGMITALTNRLGDVFLILGLGVMCSCMAFVYTDLWLCCYVADMGGFGILLSFLVISGGMTKSAVMPFSAWLPEAMAAPTPVSSLVHSSTLVTAGVYVLMRFGELFSVFCNSFLLFFSLLTAIMGGLTAVSLVDVKKIIALSTLSQVSLMMLCISVGAPQVAFFHLLTHAFFKALMFMCVGAVLYYFGGLQDSRFLGSLWANVPMVCVFFVFSNLSLMGIPFFSGFYSKELIVGACMESEMSLFSCVLVCMSLVLTFVYSCRMLRLVCFSRQSVCMRCCNSDNIFLVCSLTLMSVGGVIGSVWMQSLFSGLNACQNNSCVVFYLGMLVVISWGMILYLLGFILITTNLKVNLKSFIQSLWFMKPLSGAVMSSWCLSLMLNMMVLVDMGWIRGYIWKSGVKGVTYMGVSKMRSINSCAMGLLLGYSLVVYSLLWLW